MKQERLKTGKSALKVLLTLASIVIVVAGLKIGKDVIMPVVVAGFLAIITYPITRWLRDKAHFPHWVAVAVSVLINCSVLVGIGYLANYLVYDLSRKINAKYRELALQKYQEYSATMSEWFQSFTETNNLQGTENPLSGIATFLSDGPRILAFSTNLASMATGFLAFLVLVLILMTFFLGESRRLRRNLNKIASKDDVNSTQFVTALSGVQKYLIIKTIISTATGVLAALLCYVMNVDFALLWGIVAFALNFIPTFGSIVAAIPPVLLALIVISPGAAIVVALGYVIINGFLGNFLDPILMGKQFGIATSLVLLSVVFWGWLWGPIGMLLAVPITMLIKLGLESSDDLKWVSTLIENKPDSSKLSDIITQRAEEIFKPLNTNTRN